ncbi:hypothetical protein DUZ99_02540 [Xylanibacillus composti]|uniref:Uncharacterized protein n=1 Tax=Xylanibacillus composti TaxID=1572762 RepID=A0A8J4H0T7_9BACL|nr:hypothetical protein [Xylanibacillus composti]GIQ67347.1 hypothetical protein XYCOK13_01710 [Xylanibacillus composti]
MIEGMGRTRQRNSSAKEMSGSQSVRAMGTAGGPVSLFPVRKKDKTPLQLNKRESCGTCGVLGE